MGYHHRGLLLGLAFSTALKIVDNDAPNLALRANGDNPPSQTAVLFHSFFIRGHFVSRSQGLGITFYPPSQPLNTTSILAANRGEASFSWPQVAHDVTIPSVGALESVAWLRERQACVLDVREPWEYADGRIPGALSVPQADLARRLAEVPKDRDVLVVCATGNRSMRSAGFLKAVGHTCVTNLAGGTNGWMEASNPVETEH